MRPSLKDHLHDPVLKRIRSKLHGLGEALQIRYEENRKPFCLLCKCTSIPASNQKQIFYRFKRVFDDAKNHLRALEKLYSITLGE